MDHYHTVQLATMNLLLVCCALLVSISGSFQLRNESFPSLLHLERFIELTSQLSSSRKNNFDFAGPRADCLADEADVIDRLWGCWGWGHQRHPRHAGCHGCDRSRYGAWLLEPVLLPSRVCAAGDGLLYVPPGTYLIAPFNMTSHLTIYLEHQATLLASNLPSDWYGTGCR